MRRVSSDISGAGSGSPVVSVISDKSSVGMTPGCSSVAPEEAAPKTPPPIPPARPSSVPAPATPRYRGTSSMPASLI